ncbi:recombination and DNA strand exchange inhibitor protein [Mycobacteroides abscessus subsp. abscessus]|nr:recombination and DNA strand exchange inhibitor protein [Mycobacteroides abscessus subsp. abscessus]
MSEDSSQIENMIASLEDSRRQAEKELEEAHELLRGADMLHKDMQKQMMEYYEQKDEMQEKAAAKAADIVEKASQQKQKRGKKVRQA